MNMFPGMGGPPPGMMPPGGAPQGAPSGPPGGGGPPIDPVEHIRTAIEHVQAAVIGEPDDPDSQALARVLAALYQILAGRQKEQEAAMGTSPAIKAMSRGR